MPRASVPDDIDACGLSYSQLMELWLGPSPQDGSLFNSPEELREAWDRARAVVMRLWGNDTRRPMAWWAFDTELEYPGHDRERSFLYEHNQLSPEERAALETEWRAAFDAAKEKGAR